MTNQYFINIERSKLSSRDVNSMGFTLVELVMVILLFGILTAMVLPRFDKLLNAVRLFQRIGDFRSAVDLSRSSALTSSSNITICPSSNSTSVEPHCSPSSVKNYEDGWIVFRDCNDNRLLDLGNICDSGNASEHILSVQGPSRSIKIESERPTRLSFDDSGRTYTNFEFIIENKLQRFDLAVNRLGHVRITEGEVSP